MMDLLEGEDLNTRAERMGGKLPPEEVLAAADQLLDVLVAAHQSRADGGFDEDDVMVAISLPGVVVHAPPRQSARRRAEAAIAVSALAGRRRQQAPAAETAGAASGASRTGARGWPVDRVRSVIKVFRTKARSGYTEG